MKRNKAGYYPCPDGVDRISVTTVLKVLNKEALVGWAAKVEREAVLKVVEEVLRDPRSLTKPLTEILLEIESRIPAVKAAELALSKAGDIGTEIHDVLEHELKKQMGVPVKEVVVRPEALEAARKGLVYLKGLGFEPLLTERSVWSVYPSYAGTLDAYGIAYYKGKPVNVVADWKSGKSIYVEAILQVGAYAAALRERVLAGDIEVKIVDNLYGLIVRMPKEGGEPSALLLEPEQMLSAFNAFSHAYDLRESLEEHKKLVEWKPAKKKRAA